MGFGSDVIEVRVSPCGDALFCFGAGLVVHEIYISATRIISTIIRIYQRLFQYIDFPAKTTTIANLILKFHRRIT